MAKAIATCVTPHERVPPPPPAPAVAAVSQDPVFDSDISSPDLCVRIIVVRTLAVMLMLDILPLSGHGRCSGGNERKLSDTFLNGLAQQVTDNVNYKSRHFLDYRCNRNFARLKIQGYHNLGVTQRLFDCEQFRSLSSLEHQMLY